MDAMDEQLTIRNLDTGETIHAVNQEASLEELLSQLTTNADGGSKLEDTSERRQSLPHSLSMLTSSATFQHLMAKPPPRLARSNSFSQVDDANTSSRYRRLLMGLNKFSKNKPGAKLNSKLRSSLRFKSRGGRASSDAQENQEPKTVSEQRPNTAQYRVSQTLDQHEVIGAVMCSAFSPDGAYLAVGGATGSIVVWRACEMATDERAECLAKKPFRVYEGHRDQVVSLAWSQGNFLVTGSADGTARVWHVSRPTNLCLFEHTDCVTAVAFHPQYQDRILTASLDARLRVWDIRKQRVLSWAQAPSLITAAAFDLTGDFVVAGLAEGQCFFYTAKDMQYYTHVDCKNRRGATSDGKPVTGLHFIPAEAERVSRTSSTDTLDNRCTPPQRQKGLLLITTNDSRIRLLNMDLLTVVCKYKGNLNVNSPIKATCSGRTIIAGSETGDVYLWNLSSEARNGRPLTPQQPGKCQDCSVLHVGSAELYCAMFAPTEFVERVCDGSSSATTEESATTGASATTGDPWMLEKMIMTGNTEGLVQLWTRT